MANEQNLKPFNQITEKEQREIQRKGGKASGEARRKKADFIKVAKALMDCEISEHDKKLVEERFKELVPEEINYRTLILIKQLEKALKGDINSAKYVQDATGEKPKEEITGEFKLPVFNIQVTDNSELEKEFSEYETNTETE